MILLGLWERRGGWPWSDDRMSDVWMAMGLTVFAGIMVYISLDELLPTSRAYGKGHDSILGLIGGMGVMALSLLLMK